MIGSLDDKFLLASSISGDEQAFGKIYDKYVDEIFRFVLMRVGGKEEAQDLTSETFLKTWQYVSSSRRIIDNIRALLYRVARNLVIDYYRTAGKEVLAFDESKFQKLIDDSIDLEESVAHKDDIQTVFSSLKDLPEQARELIIMRYAHDLSILEMSKILGKGKGAVRVALHRAVKQLKEMIIKT